jgi:tetratricopeptide (TPR) repeat protein
MTQLRTTTSETWPATQAFALAAVALLLGVCGGWILRRVTAPPLAQQAAAAPAPTALPPQTPLPDLGPMAAVPSEADLRKAADSEAAPLLEQLKAAPSDAGLLVKLGNIYYDAKLYSAAIPYYERSLRIEPKDTSVRTDLGTAHWYSGDADTAIAEFNRALTYDPTKADTLFNLGIVKWQGKKDANGAVAAWQKLLDANPGYANKDRVQQFIAQARGN